MAGVRRSRRDDDLSRVLGFCPDDRLFAGGHESDWRTAFSKSMQDEAKTEGIDLKFSDARARKRSS